MSAATQYNVFNVLYLIFRLGPIFVIGFFLMQSMFNLDPRGFVYLIGLALATMLASILGQMLSIGMGGNFQQGQSYKCNTFYLGMIPVGGGAVEPLSKLPLNVLVYAYTLAYLITSFVAPPVTYNNALASLYQNLVPLIVFPLLLLFEILWLLNFSCNRLIFILVSVGLGIVCGISWAYIIRYTRQTNLQYLSLGNVEVCSRPSKAVYRCKNISK